MVFAHVGAFCARFAHTTRKVCGRLTACPLIARCLITFAERCGPTLRQAICAITARCYGVMVQETSPWDHRCGAVTHTGGQCHISVRAPGQRCAFHSVSDRHCGAPTQRGEKCVRLVNWVGERCSTHRLDIPRVADPRPPLGQCGDAGGQTASGTPCGRKAPIGEKCWSHQPSYGLRRRDVAVDARPSKLWPAEAVDVSEKCIERIERKLDVLLSLLASSQ